MATTPAGWYPDPYGRHASRYWDGGRWTEHVSDGGATAVDDPTTPAPPVAPTPTAPQAPPSWAPPTTTAPQGPPSWSPPTPSAAPPWSGPSGGGRAARSGRAADRIPAAVALGGAVLLLISAFLPWFRVQVPSVGFSETLSGMDVDDGAIVLVLAVVAAALALPRVLGAGPSLLGIGLVVVGLLATLLGVLDLGNDEPDDAFVAAVAEVDPSVGLYLVVAAGLVVAVAGAIVVATGRSPARA